VPVPDSEAFAVREPNIPSSDERLHPIPQHTSLCGEAAVSRLSVLDGLLIEKQTALRRPFHLGQLIDEGTPVEARGQPDTPKSSPSAID
jgi:hypothetical protein